MSGEAQVLNVSTGGSLVHRLVIATMTWTMPMDVDDPFGVQLGRGLAQACLENRWEYCGKRRLIVLDGQAGTQVFRAWDMAGRMTMVTAAEACCEP